MHLLKKINNWPVRTKAQAIDRPVALVTGCFDVIHVGHIMLLQHAGDFGSVWVGLNSDEAVTILKGPTRPINSYKDRALVMSSIGVVDNIFEIYSTRVDQAILAVKPKAWIKGGDYTMDTLDKDEVAAAKLVGAEIVLFPTEAGYSTTDTLKKLAT